MISIGALRRRVILEEPIISETLGQPVETWREVAKLWAEIRDASGFEENDADAQNAVRRVRVTLRFRETIDSRMRFRIGARRLAIRAIIDSDGLRRFLTCMCEEEPVRDAAAAGS